MYYVFLGASESPAVPLSQDTANLLGADKDFGSLDAANGEMPEVVKQQLLRLSMGTIGEDWQIIFSESMRIM